jgi:hypothetical protein
VKFRSRTLLSLEFLLLFAIVPLFLVTHRPVVPPIPLLWLVAGYCLLVLWRDPDYPRAQLWNMAALRGQLRSILLLFALGAVLIALLVWKFAPGQLFNFVRTHPGFWALVMLLYPVLSVYPQGIIYRAFVLHRYRNLPLAPAKQRWALIILSALAFSFMHIVFRNWIAVALTLVGGVLFARRHVETQSLFVSSLEHALYGCFLFTIGLGTYFYARLI